MQCHADLLGRAEDDEESSSNTRLSISCEVKWRDGGRREGERQGGERERERREGDREDFLILCTLATLTVLSQTRKN